MEVEPSGSTRHMYHGARQMSAYNSASGKASVSGLQPYQPAHHDQQIGQQQRERNPRQQIEREPALFGNQGMHGGLVRSAAG